MNEENDCAEQQSMRHRPGRLSAGRRAPGGPDDRADLADNAGLKRAAAPRPTQNEWRRVGGCRYVLFLPSIAKVTAYLGSADINEEQLGDGVALARTPSGGAQIILGPPDGEH
jgi:hypothetical protein